MSYRCISLVVVGLIVTLCQYHSQTVGWKDCPSSTEISVESRRLSPQSNLSQHHEPIRSLCSCCNHQLSVPHYNLTLGFRAFRFSTLRVWNSLPVSIHESQSLPTFRCHLKTFYSQSAYPLQLPTWSRISSSARPNSSK